MHFRRGLTDEDIVRFAEDFLNGIKKRGKAKPGDRTIVDSLQPAAESLRAFYEKGKSLSDSCPAAWQAAQSGVEKTKSMLPVFGRAVYFDKKVLGSPDQSAVVGSLIFEALYNTIFTLE